MQNEIEKAGPHQVVNVRSELKEIGVTAPHEDQYHQQISADLKSAHSEAGTTKDAEVPSVKSTPNLVQFPEKKTGSKPMEDTSWGERVMALKLFKRGQKKGKLPHAA